MLRFELSLGPVPQFPFLSIDQLCVMSWPLSEDPQPSRHPPGPTPAAQLCAVPGLIRLIPLSYPRQPLLPVPYAYGASPSPAWCGQGENVRGQCRKLG